MLEYDSAVIGVEITELVRKLPVRGSRSWEGACEAVLETAKWVWESLSLPSVDVSVIFNMHHDMEGKIRLITCHAQLRTMVT